MDAYELIATGSIFGNQESDVEVDMQPEIMGWAVVAAVWKCMVFILRECRERSSSDPPLPVKSQMNFKNNFPISKT